MRLVIVTELTRGQAFLEITIEDNRSREVNVNEERDGKEQLLNRREDNDGSSLINGANRAHLELSVLHNLQTSYYQIQDTRVSENLKIKE